jgi:hypothetical protein
VVPLLTAALVIPERRDGATTRSNFTRMYQSDLLAFSQRMVLGAPLWPKALSCTQTRPVGVWRILAIPTSPDAST